MKITKKNFIEYITKNKNKIDFEGIKKAGGIDLVYKKLKEGDNKKNVIKEDVTKQDTTPDPAITNFQGTSIADQQFRIDQDELNRIKDRSYEQNLPYYNEVKGNLKQDYNTKKLEIDRLIQYTNTDFANELASTNKSFARSLDKATNVYGQRGLLGSGIQKSQVGESTTDYEKQITNMEEYRRRKEEGLETQGQNIKTMYDRNLTDTGRNQEAQYYYDVINQVQGRRQDWENDLMNYNKSQLSGGQVAMPTGPTNGYTQKDLNEQNLYKINKTFY